MKNFFFLIAIILGITASSFAQNARMTKDEFMKVGSVDATTITIDGFTKNVEEVLERKFKKETGQKPKSKGKFKTFPGVYYKSIAEKTLDMYYKLEKAGSKDNPKTKVTLYLSLGGENFLDPKKYPDEVKAAMNVLEELPKEVYEYELELAIQDQTKVMQKAVKEYQKMETDSLNLETKRIETLQAIEENTSSLEQQRIRIAEEEEAMGELKSLLESSKSGKGKLENTKIAE